MPDNKIDDWQTGKVVRFPVKNKIRGAVVVQLIDQYQFVMIGEALADLKKIHELKFQQASFPLRNAQSRLERLLKGEPIPIKFSRAAAEGLVREIKRFEAVIDRTDLDDEKQNEQVGFPHFYPVWTAIETLQHTLAAEFKNCSVYHVPKKGIYDTADLIDRADEQIPEELRRFVPEICQSEFREAGRCLAFNLPSSAGFHIARAVEALLIEYAKFFGANVSVETATMGDCVKALEAIQNDSSLSTKPKAKTLRTVKDIKDFDRNPLMHPRAVLTEVEALSLFSLGHSTISAMALELRQLGDEVKQDALPLIPKIETVAELEPTNESGIGKAVSSNNQSSSKNASKTAQEGTEKKVTTRRRKRIA